MEMDVAGYGRDLIGSIISALSRGPEKSHENPRAR